MSEIRWQGDIFRIIPLLRNHHPELQFRTLVGAGNEQTVPWKTDAKYESVAVDDATLESYGHVTYEETLARGDPEYFMPGSGDEVLTDVVENLGNQHIRPRRLGRTTSHRLRSMTTKGKTRELRQSAVVWVGNAADIGRNRRRVVLFEVFGLAFRVMES